MIAFACGVDREKLQLEAVFTAQLEAVFTASNDVCDRPGNKLGERK